MKQVVITCEHAGNEVPDAYKKLFRTMEFVLESHRGYDPGAFLVAEKLSQLCDAQFFYTKITRLLVEPNRSLHHYQLFSDFTKELNIVEQDRLLRNYYFPYRNAVDKWIKDTLAKGDEVIHLSIHSFAPVVEGKIRQCQIGLLFDPLREEEVKLTKGWRLDLINRGFNAKNNYPYKGTSDGLISHLRRKYQKGYVGIEIEVNQDMIKDETNAHWIAQELHKTIEEVCMHNS